jgi:hypothetical protein
LPRRSCRTRTSTRSWSGSIQPRPRCARSNKADCAPASTSTTRQARWP